MEEYSSTSSGALICASTLSVAFIVSFVLLKARCNHRPKGRDLAPLPPCKHCRQSLAFDNKRIENIQTKGWTCSACSGYNGATEVRGGCEESLQMKGPLSLVLGKSDLFGGNYFKWLVMLVLMVFGMMLFVLTVYGISPLSAGFSWW